MMGLFSQDGRLLSRGARLSGCCCDNWVVYLGCVTGKTLAQPSGLLQITPQRAGFTSWNAVKTHGNMGVFGFCRQSDFQSAAYFADDYHFPYGTSFDDMSANPFGGFALCSLTQFGVYPSAAMAQAVCQTWQADFEDFLVCSRCGSGCAAATADSYTFGGLPVDGYADHVLSNAAECADRKITVEFQNALFVELFGVIFTDNVPAGDPYWGTLSPVRRWDGGRVEGSGSLVAAVPPRSSFYVHITKSSTAVVPYSLAVTVDGFSLPSCAGNPTLDDVPRNADEYNVRRLSARLAEELE